MKLWNLFRMAFFTFSLTLSQISVAAVISVDWQSVNDGLITRDTSSGLDWLDLTLTNEASYRDTLTQLQAGEQFYGWRYATNAEVIALWSNFGVDLSSAATGIAYGFDSTVDNASYMLGNTLCEYNCNLFPFGTLGLTGDAYDDAPNSRSLIGAYAFKPAYSTAYLTDGNYYMSDFDSAAHTGSYLVQTSPIPVPAALWLFGSGLIGMAGIARRKKPA